MNSERAVLVLLAACAHVRPHASAKPSGDDLTLYRDVAVVRQRVVLDGASATVAVPDGVTADDALVIDGTAKLRSGEPGTLIVDFGTAGRHAIVLGYITDKLRWDAAYTMITTPARDRAVLRGALAIRNTSGIPLHGLTHVIDTDLGARRANQIASEPAPDATQPPPSRDLGSLVLAAGETRVGLVEGGPRRMRAVLVYDPIGTKLDNTSSIPLRDPSLGIADPVSSKVSESLEITRDKQETAGLPAGPVRLLERQPDGRLALLGESRLFDTETRRSAIDTIAIGTADGVTARRERRELTDEESRHRLVEEFLIEIDNTRARPADILVREHLYRGQTWALAYWSVEDIHQEGAQSITMRTRVPAHGQVKILYVVVYTWGT
jgi:hypothetical protein